MTNMMSNVCHENCSDFSLSAYDLAVPLFDFAMAWCELSVYPHMFGICA